MGGLCVSEHAFNDYFSRDETRDLRSAYRAADMKQFHYMNAATKKLTSVSWFYSYYTAIVGTSYTYNEYTEHANIFVQPFIFDTDYFRNSCTTNRQANRWLKERGFNVTVQELRTIYRNAIRGLTSHPIYTNDGTLITPRFDNAQMMLDKYGKIDIHVHCDSVPHIEYNNDASALVAVGKFVQRSNVCGLMRG